MNILHILYMKSSKVYHNKKKFPSSDIENKAKAIKTTKLYPLAAYVSALSRESQRDVVYPG